MERGEHEPLKKELTSATQLVREAIDGEGAADVAGMLKTVTTVVSAGAKVAERDAIEKREGISHLVRVGGGGGCLEAAVEALLGRAKVRTVQLGPTGKRRGLPRRCRCATPQRMHHQRPCRS